MSNEKPGFDWLGDLTAWEYRSPSIVAVRVLHNLHDRVKALEGQTETHEQRLDAAVAAYKDYLALVERVRALESYMEPGQASPQDNPDLADLRARVAQFVKWVHSLKGNTWRDGERPVPPDEVMLLKLRELGLIEK